MKALLQENKDVFVVAHDPHAETGERFRQMSARSSVASVSIGQVVRLREILSQKDFVAMVSHDLRTPLTNLRGFLELINMGVYEKNPDLLRQQAKQAESNVNRLLRLIRDLLDIEQLISGKILLNPTKVDCRELAKAAIGQVEFLAANASVQLCSRVTTDYLYADRERIVQVLVNLLSNAIKFTDRGGFVKLSIDESKEYWSLTVTDSGKGIPAERLARIFEPFEQAECGHSAGERDGTGLGLTISNALIEAHAGTICVESRVGIGSQFRCRLPKSISA